MLSLFCDRR